jgi:hypothetical protein
MNTQVQQETFLGFHGAHAPPGGNRWELYSSFSDGTKLDWLLDFDAIEFVPILHSVQTLVLTFLPTEELSFHLSFPTGSSRALSKPVNGFSSTKTALNFNTQSRPQCRVTESFLATRSGLGFSTERLHSKPMFGAATRHMRRQTQP